MVGIFKSTPWQYFVVGAGLGYVVIHPLIMIIADLMLASSSVSDYWELEHILSVVQHAFGSAMLPWGIGLGLLCAVAGWLLAKVGQAMAKEQKLHGVLELAGAACHELNQPMQVVLGYSEMLAGDLSPDDPRRKTLEKIIRQIGKMDQILKNIRAITRYETKPYIEGTTIIDIEKAADWKAQRSR